MVQRVGYLGRLAKLRDTQPVKLLSGVRGCGKTTLLAQYIDWLRRSGVDDRQIIFINMEDPESESLLHYQGLYSYIKKRLCTDKLTYVFIDEIQKCANFEKAVAGLFIKKQVVDIYAAASNLCNLSGIPHIEIPVLPLSFAEYLLFSRAKSRNPPLPLNNPPDVKNDRRLPRQKERMEKYLQQEAFNNYASFGGLPFASALNGDTDLILRCVEGIYDTIVIREMAQQPGVNDISLLENIAKLMSHSIGRPLSSKKISAAIGRKISCNTVEIYMRALCGAFVFYHIVRYDIRAGKKLKTLGKYYIADTGIRNLRLRSAHNAPAQNAPANDLPDMDAQLENIVCMELLRRGFQVCTGKNSKDEINFVTFGRSDTDNAGPTYIQVTATIRDKPVYSRKFSALERIRNKSPKIILSLDEIPARSIRNGIAHQNLIEWLAGS